MAKTLNFAAEAERLQRENDALKFLERLFEQAVRHEFGLSVDQIHATVERATAMEQQLMARKPVQKDATQPQSQGQQFAPGPQGQG